MDTKYGPLLYFCIGWTHMDNWVNFFYFSAPALPAWRLSLALGFVNYQSVVWLIEEAEQDSAPSGGS